MCRRSHPCALFEAGIGLEPIGSLTEWALRVDDFVAKGGIDTAKLMLVPANFVPNKMHPSATPTVAVPNKLKWTHQLSFGTCVQSSRSKRGVPFAEFALIIGEISTEALQADGSKAVAMSWAMVGAIAESDATVKAVMKSCERAPAGERNATYDWWSEPLAVAIVSFWERTEWQQVAPELFMLEDTMLWRGAEVQARVYRGEGTIQKGHYTKVALFGPFFACFLTDVFWEQMWLTNSKLDF
jgi:hypothetical protein